MSLKTYVFLFVCFKGEEETGIYNSGHSGTTLMVPLMPKLLFSTQLISFWDSLPCFQFSPATSNTQSFHATFPSLINVFLC